MELPRDAVLLRVFFGEDDKFGHLPLYEAIVLKAREMHLAGVTVLRGHVGFGHKSRIHTTKILRLSQDLPIVVEIVDRQDKSGFAIQSALDMSGRVPAQRAVQPSGRLSRGPGYRGPVYADEPVYVEPPEVYYEPRPYYYGYYGPSYRRYWGWRRW